VKSRILVIEDDYTLRVMLEDNLAAQGWEISTASDGKTGLDAACRWRADLIILDIMLPEINGYEICRYGRGRNPSLDVDGEGARRRRRPGSWGRC